MTALTTYLAMHAPGGSGRTSDVVDVSQLLFTFIDRSSIQQEVFLAKGLVQLGGKRLRPEHRVPRLRAVLLRAKYGKKIPSGSNADDTITRGLVMAALLELGVRLQVSQSWMFPPVASSCLMSLCRAGNWRFFSIISKQQLLHHPWQRLRRAPS